MGDWHPRQGPGGGGLTDWGQAATAHFHGSGSPVGVVTPGGIGDLYVDDTTPALWQATGLTSADWSQVGGGGSQPGTVQVIGFSFAFDTPGLSDGIPFYTPTVGDLLLDAWMQIGSPDGTPWDGTTPLGDFGTGANAGSGTFAEEGVTSAVQMDYWAGTTDNGSPAWVYWTGANGNAGAHFGSSDLRQAIAYNQGVGARGSVLSAEQLYVWVSQDGLKGGADPGASQGAAVLYLMIAKSPTITAL